MESFAAHWCKHFNDYKIKELDVRYVNFERLSRVIDGLPKSVKKEEIGRSFEDRPIVKLQMGRGSKTVIAWACMHGNETTSLRGWMDLFMNQENSDVKHFFSPLLDRFTIHFIPMLNPDGAQRFTRRNAMGLDMNRDARAVETPEIKVLMAQLNSLKPDLAFNLHDQRNIFSVNGKSATLSFLAPSEDVQRSIKPLRAKTMDLIGCGANEISPFLHGGIGRYTDEFYPTAIGERVQEMGIPAILVECGAAINDPLRQEPRKLNAPFLLAVLQRFLENETPDISTYQNIPLNEQRQIDILIKNVVFQKDEKTFVADLALREEFLLKQEKLVSRYVIHDFGDLRHMVGLEEFDAARTSLNALKVGAKASFTINTKHGKLQFEDGSRI